MVNQSVICRALNWYQRHGNASHCQSGARQRSTSQRDARLFHIQTRRFSFVTATQLRFELVNVTGMAVSTQTIRNWLNKTGMGALYLYSTVQRTQATSVYLDARSYQLVPLELELELEANYFSRTSLDTVSTLLIIIQRSEKYHDSKIQNMIITGMGQSRYEANWTCMHSITERLPVNGTIV